MKEKPGLAIIIANGKGPYGAGRKGPHEGEEGEEEQGDIARREGALEAIEGFISALKSDEPEMALEEFKNLLDLVTE